MLTAVSLLQGTETCGSASVDLRNYSINCDFFLFPPTSMTTLIIQKSKTVRNKYLKSLWLNNSQRINKLDLIKSLRQPLIFIILKKNQWKPPMSTALKPAFHTQIRQTWNGCHVRSWKLMQLFSHTAHFLFWNHIVNPFEAGCNHSHRGKIQTRTPDIFCRPPAGKRHSVSRQLLSILAANCAFRKAKAHTNNTERKLSCEETTYPWPTVSLLQ